jgi:hypothetical protein
LDDGDAGFGPGVAAHRLDGAVAPSSAFVDRDHAAGTSHHVT